MSNADADDDSFCCFCRSNRFDDFGKHLRTSTHKTKVDKSLTAQRRKFTLAKSTFTQPVIDPSTATSDEQCFWCHLCDDEFVKHWLDESKRLKVENGGMVAHFASAVHRTSVISVRKKYRLQMALDDFAFPSSVIQQFGERVNKELVKYSDMKNANLQETASKFRQLDEIRSKLVEDSRNSNGGRSETRELSPDDIHPNSDDYSNRNSKLPSTDFGLNSRMRKRFKQTVHTKK